MTSDSSTRDWGFWTEVKLNALERYLTSFTTASKRALSTLYLDLFAGQIDNKSRDNPDSHFTGSTVRALKTVPAFDRLFFFELPPLAKELRKDLSRKYPKDRRYKVVEGNCNQTIFPLLTELQQRGGDMSPTFCLIDPDGLDVNWSTIQAVASFKNRHARTKAEMWILFSHTTVCRLAGYDRSLGFDQQYSESATLFFGTSAWRSIYEKRVRNL